MFQFEKVSLEQFIQDCTGFCTNEYALEQAYNQIKLPEAKTPGSAGFDFYAPFHIDIYSDSKVRIPTGIRWICEDEDLVRYETRDGVYHGTHFGFYLQLVPRSSLGCKYRLQLSNTMGIIDADYWKSDNGGHILVDIYRPPMLEVVKSWYTNDENGILNMVSFPKRGHDAFDNEVLTIEAGSAFVQGIIQPYVKLPEYTRKEVRNGGFGSTDE